MCGIVGCIGPSSEQRQELFLRLAGRLSHRGDSAFQAEHASTARFIAGTNRMRITSRADGVQPIHSSDGRVTLCFNGELYNHQQLATDYDLTSNTLLDGDGAVAADMLALQGLGAISDFDGMFGMFWFDQSTGAMYFARDHIGIKPLYYGFADQYLLFASEMKALAPEPSVTEIFEVSPGTIIEITETGQRPALISKRYFQFGDIEASTTASTDEFRQLILQSVELQCRYSDGPIGVYLSGGVDSSGIYAMTRLFRNDVCPVVLGTKNSSDLLAARRLTGEFGDGLIVGTCPSEDELFATIADTIRCCESFEPNVVRTSSVSLKIALTAKDAGLKVILCGEGADELFCGYPEFWYMQDEWHETRLAFLSDLHRTQLQRVDRTSMSVTTEVRVPYLGRQVVRAALSFQERSAFLGPRLEGWENKLLLRNALKGILPEWQRTRPKIVLSEGAGLRGVDPEQGMFSDLANAVLSKRESLDLIRSFPEWKLGSYEEAFYFKLFHELGYSKAKFMTNRIRVTKKCSTTEAKLLEPAIKCGPHLEHHGNGHTNSEVEVIRGNSRR